MKPFRYYIPKFPYDPHRTGQEQIDAVFAQHDELLAQLDRRIRWAKNRSQREDWWDFDLRSCSGHYALIDGFDRKAANIREDVSTNLLFALWGIMRREDWRTIKVHIALASDGVNRINQMFRRTRNS